MPSLPARPRSSGRDRAPGRAHGAEGWRPAAAHGGRAYSGGAASPPSRPTGDMRASDMRAGRSAQTWRFWGELNIQKNRTKAAQCGHLLPQSNGGSESDPSSPSCGAAGHRLPRPRSAGRSACSRLRGGAPAPTAGPPAWTCPRACRSSAYLPQVAPDPALAAVSQVAGLAPEPGLQTWEGKTRCLQPGPAGGAGARGPREALAVPCRARRGLWPGRWDSAVHSVEGLARHPGASARQQLKPRLLRGLQSLRAASNWLNRPV